MAAGHVGENVLYRYMFYVLNICYIIISFSATHKMV